VRVPGAAVVVLNAGGETFARVRLDEQSWAAVEAGLSQVPDDLARALLWSVATDRARTGDLAFDDLLALVRDHLPGEPHPAIVSAVLRWVGIVLPLVASADTAGDAVAATAGACAAALDTGPSPDLAVVWTRKLAAADTDHDRLRAWAAASDDPALRWIALHRLASLGALDHDAIERERAADGTVVGDLGAGRALAAIPDADAKAAAWARMTEDPHISNRLFEAMAEGFWDVEQTELVAPYVARYWTEAPRLGAARGPSFCARLGNAFPWVPLTDEQIGDLETALAGEVPAILRRDWEDALDDLQAVKIG
jgi:aminopeptidase N